MTPFIINDISCIKELASGEEEKCTSADMSSDDTVKPSTVVEINGTGLKM